MRTPGGESPIRYQRVCFVEILHARVTLASALNQLACALVNGFAVVRLSGEDSFLD